MPDSFVRFDTNFGSFTVELYNSVAPQTVQNFLNYVNSGRYDGSFFHRLVAGFVLQGGGFDYTANGVASIPTDAPVANEYNASYPDVAGTIAMAKLGGNPNSATDQFFFNLADNSSTLGPAQNGGFTVFGRVVQGYGVVQMIAALPVANAGSPFDTLPVHDYTSGNVSRDNLVLLNDVVDVTPVTYAWRGGSGDWGTAANWANIRTGADPSAVVPGITDAVGFTGYGGTLTGSGAAASLLFASGAWVLAGQFTTNSIGASAPFLTIGSAGTGSNVTVAAGARLDSESALVRSNSALYIAGGGSARIAGSLENDGSSGSAGYLTIGVLSGSGSFSVQGGVTDVGALASTSVTMATNTGVLRAHALSGNTTVSGMRFGDSIDLASITGARLTGNTVTAGGGTLTLAAAPTGYTYKLYGDAAGGTQVLLNPTTPQASAISYTDISAASSGSAAGDDYTGPVDYLQRQYIWPGAGTDALAIRANVPNAFLKGGAGDDALQALAGNNVLDGGPGSNFLIGGSGADGGKDTFFVDARDPATITWGTIVNFHQGDQATIFGFHPGLSTRPETALDGVAGFQGMTIHSEIGGAGTGVNASMTFAGIDQATADAHFVYSTGTLPGNIDYLLIQYT